jgi:hypothetical protein
MYYTTCLTTYIDTLVDNWPVAVQVKLYLWGLVYGEGDLKALQGSFSNQRVGLCQFRLCNYNIKGCYWCILTISPLKTHNFGPKKIWLRSYGNSLHVHIIFVAVGCGWCSANFKRDIVDTLCHTSCRSGTIRPNKTGFLL